MTENKNVILSARDIVVEFDVRDRVLTAIRGVSLDLVEGEVLALVGESGSGKSVLTKTFTGMLEENGRVASGSIDYRGKDLTKFKSHQDWAAIRGAKIATIFQDPMTSLNPIKTIGSQIIEVIVKHQGKTAKEAKKMAIDYMDKVGIPDAEKRFNEYPFQYSGGMRQRIVILINIFLIPVFGYMACAWAGFAGYGVAMLLSYFVGQKKYPINYDLKAIGNYVALALVLYIVSVYLPIQNIFLLLGVRTLLLLLFVAYIVKTDFPLQQIPVINRYIKK